MQTIYQMPSMRKRLFVNMIYSCPNRCVFCVDFFCNEFYGQDLKIKGKLSVKDIYQDIIEYEHLNNIEELYLCGIGEPLLRYDDCIELAVLIKKNLPNIMVGINTSGTYYIKNKRTNFIDYFDWVQISINAENQKKYNAICRPKNKDTYTDVLRFLDALKFYSIQNKTAAYIELSMVDLNNQYADLKIKEEFIPDVEETKVFAAKYDWPLKIHNFVNNFELNKVSG